jgi:hypothetical protein
VSLTSKIPIAVIALVAVVGGLGTGMAASLGLAPSSPFQSADADAPVEGEERISIHELGDYVINLNEPGGGRLLRMKLRVEANETTAEPTPASRGRRARRPSGPSCWPASTASWIRTRWNRSTSTASSSSSRRFPSPHQAALPGGLTRCIETARMCRGKKMRCLHEKKHLGP